MYGNYQLVEPRGVNSQDLSVIGEGAYGIVYKALDTVTGNHVALKKIRMESEGEGIPPSTLREVTLLAQLQHENVVKLENVILHNDRMCLVFELIDTDLKKLMDATKAPLLPDEVQVSSRYIQYKTK